MIKSPDRRIAVFVLLLAFAILAGAIWLGARSHWHDVDRILWIGVAAFCALLVLSWFFFQRANERMPVPTNPMAAAIGAGIFAAAGLVFLGFALLGAYSLIRDGVTRRGIIVLVSFGFFAALGWHGFVESLHKRREAIGESEKRNPSDR